MRVFFLCLFSAVTVFNTFGEENSKIKLISTFGFGLSGSEVTVVDGYSFGRDGFGNSSYFKDPPSIDIVFAKRFALGLEYFVDNKNAGYINLGYLERPFSVTFYKNTFSSDLVYYSDYRFIQFSLGYNHYFKWFFCGCDFNYNLLIENNSEIIEGDYRFSSTFADSNNTYSIGINFGPFLGVGSNKLKSFVRINWDLSKVFTLPNYVEDLTLIDISLNLSTSI